MTNQLTFGSLFAGIGGFDLGFERAGMVCKWQVEIDDYATRVLEKHWPNVRRHRDVRECGAANLEPVDVICGGFPCQDISYAGLGAGLAGERSGLFYEAIRIVRELGPRFVVLENVSALLTRGMGDVLGTLAACGFDAEWACIPASCIGAPHIRDRVFIVAYSAQVRWASVKGVFARQAERELGRNYRDTGEPWAGESGVCPVVDGVPFQLEQLAGYGNAVVPQVAEWIGRRIVEAAK
jgi:DNA (cytosine-5)-methyltransferase 1